MIDNAHRYRDNSDNRIGRDETIIDIGLEAPICHTGPDAPEPASGTGDVHTQSVAKYVKSWGDESRER